MVYQAEIIIWHIGGLTTQSSSSMGLTGFQAEFILWHIGGLTIQIFQSWRLSFQAELVVWHIGGLTTELSPCNGVYVVFQVEFAVRLISGSMT